MRMHPFKLGDLVVCINDTPLPEKIIRIGEPWVKIGRTYMVSGASTNEVGDHGIVLLEIKQWPPAAGWHAWRFKKLYNTEDRAEAEPRCRELEHA
jgi:hypothetical protein